MPNVLHSQMLLCSISRWEWDTSLDDQHVDYRN